MGTLEGKSAIVTGSGRGIGRAEALALAAEGAAVIVNDVDADQAEAVAAEIAAAGGRASVSTEDVATWAGAEAVVEQALDEHGRLDVLVNNAGILRDAMSFSMTEADWDDVIRVHLKGHAATSHFAGAHWRARAKAGEQPSGRIINTTSESGLYGLAGQVNYATAKAGIAAMTIVLGRELRKYGVTVNAIAPRARTRMTETVLAGLEPEEGRFDEWDPANIAPVVAWLAGDDAADVSGQVFVVFANRLHLMDGWDLANTIETEGRWTIDEFRARKAELFADRSSGLPRMGFGS
ncbi:SDR family NAD(P)-dependent oxidoreductase [Rhabdothermincola sediminis]|uniref:SDR family NAD(P)-dependent oxidoreductase n=1 Tax=Rhabdothermincola sediminis TaxID=2751370 RepID=UPI001AA032A0|nr:SDR family NAD(P)-dependent oxidoreductase [Rhabdothermincola sediminis]